MQPRKLVEALAAAEACAEESFEPVGAGLQVWSLRRSTWHPLLSDALAGYAAAEPGFLLVSARTEGDAVREVDVCRSEFPFGGGPPLPAPAAGAAGGLGQGAFAGDLRPPCFEFGLLEERLAPVGLHAARRLLTEITRARLRLSRPVLIAVGGDGVASKRHATAYIGIRTGSADDDGVCPEIAETIHVTRPHFEDEEQVTVGDVLCRCRGAVTRPEVQIRARWDHALSPEAPPTAAQASAGSRRPELRSGPFIALEHSWPMVFERAAAVPLARPPSTWLGGDGAVVHIRGGGEGGSRGETGVEGVAALTRDLLDLLVLERLIGFAPSRSDEELQPQCRRGTALRGEELAREAVLELLDEEASAAATVPALGSRPQPPPAKGGSEEEDGRPSRDFVDRLWLRIFSRCATCQCLMAAMHTLVDELRRPECAAPFVRRTNCTEAAELVRLAVKMSTLQRYAGRSEAEKVEAAARQWRERCQYYSERRHAVALAAGAGAECLSRDFVHIITAQDSVTAQDLAPLLHDVPELAAASPEAAQQHTAPPPNADALRRLRCLRRVAEVVVIASRHRVCADTLRRLVLRAVEYYQQPALQFGLAAPIFSASLSRASCSRVLASLLVEEPSSFTVRCGGSFVHVERRSPHWSAVDGGTDGEEEAEMDDAAAATAACGRQGTWRPPGHGGLLEYTVTVVDRCAFSA